MNIRNRLQELEHRHVGPLVTVLKQGEHFVEAAARCREAAGAPPHREVLVVDTGVPQPAEGELQL